MGLTNFPNGITSFGIPLYGSGNFPYDSPGNHYFVDLTDGSDVINSGKSWDTAKASIEAGYALCTTGKNDVLHILGAASGYASTSVLTLDKDFTHIVGHTAGIVGGGRVRITNSVTTATAGEFVHSGTGCVFDNLHFQWGGSATAASLIGLAISGDGRNMYRGCHFEGPSQTDIGGAVGQRMVTLTSAQDNTFLGCTFGQRTVENTSATGAILSFNGSNNTGNAFKDCLFLSYNTNTASGFVNFVDGAMPGSGWTLFDNCNFVECAGTVVADVIRFTTAASGKVILKNCGLIGENQAVWATNFPTTIFNCNPVGAPTGGLGIDPA